MTKSQIIGTACIFQRAAVGLEERLSHVSFVFAGDHRSHPEFKKRQGASVVIARSFKMLALGVAAFLESEPLLKFVRGAFVHVLNLYPARCRLC